VKKQRKYNLARVVITGRINIAVRAACEGIYRGMLKRTDADWKEDPKLPRKPPLRAGIRKHQVCVVADVVVIEKHIYTFARAFCNSKNSCWSEERPMAQNIPL
jgi:hypothetical protein